MSPSILQRIANGDTSAVRECIVQYGALVWSLACRLSKTRTDAEDATQEIFVQIWNQANRYDASLGSEMIFIVMIARRRLIDRLRAATFELPINSPVQLVKSVAWTKLVNTVAGCDCQDAAAAMRVLSTLRPEHRQVLILGVLHGSTQSEIANRLSLPLRTVKSWMRLGLMGIRECLHREIPSAAAALTPYRSQTRAFDLDRLPIDADRLNRPAVALPIHVRNRSL